MSSKSSSSSDIIWLSSLVGIEGTGNTLVKGWM